MAIIGLPPEITGAKFQNTARLGLIRGTMPHRRQLAAATANITFSTAWALESEFDLVRLVYQNNQATAYTITAATIAPSATINNGYDPVDAAGAAVAFTPVTFNDLGAYSGLSPSAAGSATSLAMPTTADANVPAYGVSDWMRIASMPRTDATDGRRVLMARTVAAADISRVERLTQAIMTAFRPYEAGRILRAFYKSGGDFTASGFTSPVEDGYLQPVAIQYYTRKRGATVLVIGDSLTQGQDVDSTEHFAWGHFASADLTTQNLPISFVNGGRAGSTSLFYYQTGMQNIALFRPEVATINVWTPNDSRNAVAADLAFARALDIAAYTHTMGGVPVFVTAVPFDLSTADDTLRRTINDRARAAAAAGNLLLIDADLAVTDKMTPARALPAYHAASGSHLSIAGYQAISAIAKPVLERALGLR
jgi:lysophospholipase L1-like esterase